MHRHSIDSKRKNKGTTRARERERDAERERERDEESERETERERGRERESASQTHPTLPTRAQFLGLAHADLGLLPQPQQGLDCRLHSIHHSTTFLDRLSSMQHATTAVGWPTLEHHERLPRD